MDDTQFSALAERTFREIEVFLDQNMFDLDYSMVSDHVMEIETDDLQKIIISRYLPLSQLWIASSNGAFHFQWDGKIWSDTRHNKDIYSVIIQLLQKT